MSINPFRSINLVVQVNLDGESTLYTFEAYRELRLQMSTGDFHCHTTSFVNADTDEQFYVDLDEDGEFINVNEQTIVDTAK